MKFMALYLLSIIGAAIQWLSFQFVMSVATKYGATSFDWEEITMICIGAGAFAYIINDNKRERKLDHYAISISEELSRLKVMCGDGNQHSLAERVAAIEAVHENMSHTSERLDNLVALVAALETRIEYGERITALETRADYTPVRPTQKRDENGKYAGKKKTEVAVPVVEEK